MTEGMYLRTTQRRNKDNSVVRYVRLAHNQRHGHSTTVGVLVNFGREDALYLEKLRRLVRCVGLDRQCQSDRPAQVRHR